MGPLQGNSVSKISHFQRSINRVNNIARAPLTNFALIEKMSPKQRNTGSSPPISSLQRSHRFVLVFTLTGIMSCSLTDQIMVSIATLKGYTDAFDQNL